MPILSLSIHLFSVTSFVSSRMKSYNMEPSETGFFFPIIMSLKVVQAIFFFNGLVLWIAV